MAIYFLTVGVAINNNGANYRLGDVLSVVGGVGGITTLVVTAINGSGGIQGLTINNAGSYSTLPTLIDVSTIATPIGGTSRRPPRRLYGQCFRRPWQ